MEGKLGAVITLMSVIVAVEVKSHGSRQLVVTNPLSFEGNTFWIIICDPMVTVYQIWNF